MRRLILFVSLMALSTTACTKLSSGQDPNAAQLTPLAELSAAYGQLVAVTVAPQQEGATGWREMWFENHDTGAVTYVPVLLPQWNHDPKSIKTFTRP